MRACLSHRPPHFLTITINTFHMPGWWNLTLHCCYNLSHRYPSLKISACYALKGCRKAALWENKSIIERAIDHSAVAKVMLFVELAKFIRVIFQFKSFHFFHFLATLFTNQFNEYRDCKIRWFNVRTIWILWINYVLLPINHYLIVYKKTFKQEISDFTVRGD